MIVGSLKARLLVRGSRSLKDKRQVVRSVLDRVRHQFGVAAAEVDAHDDHRLIVLGFAAVGAEAGPVKQALQAIADALRVHPVAEYLGRPSVFLDGGAAVVKDLELRDGIIDLDVATPAARGFFGIQFRM